MFFSIILPSRNLAEAKDMIYAYNGKVLQENQMREFDDIEESVIPFIKILYSGEIMIYPLNAFLININNHFQVKQNSL